MQNTLGASQRASGQDLIQQSPEEAAGPRDPCSLGTVSLEHKESPSQSAEACTAEQGTPCQAGAIPSGRCLHSSSSPAPFPLTARSLLTENPAILSSPVPLLCLFSFPAPTFVPCSTDKLRLEPAMLEEQKGDQPDPKWALRHFATAHFYRQSNILWRMKW